MAAVGDNSEPRSEEDARDEEFTKSNLRYVGVSEWKVLLALAYGGAQSMFQIAKTNGFKYPMVHGAAKRLEAIKWIKVLRTEISQKNVPKRIYGLTAEGLLWMLSKMPKTMHETLGDTSLSDSEGLRKILNEKDISDLGSLRNAKDVYLHLLLEFDLRVHAIAKNNSNLFPLIFERCSDLNDQRAGSIPWSSPRIAFSTLIEYYYNYESLFDKLGSLEMLFTCLVYQHYLEGSAESAVNFPSDLENEQFEEVEKTFKCNPHVLKLFGLIYGDLENKTARKHAFLKKVKSRISDS